MSTEVAVKLADEAKEDLDRLGRIRSRLLFRVLYDELRTPDPSLAADPIVAGSGTDWRALEVGDYRVIYRNDDSGGEPQHFVARVVPRDDVQKVVQSGDLDIGHSAASPTTSG
jgi:mRNA-degrading endonuclease RelE of RelBE toxin-antitoxin system